MSLKWTWELDQSDFCISLQTITCISQKTFALFRKNITLHFLRNFYFLSRFPEKLGVLLQKYCIPLWIALRNSAFIRKACCILSQKYCIPRKTLRFFTKIFPEETLHSFAKALKHIFSVDHTNIISISSRASEENTKLWNYSWVWNYSFESDLIKQSTVNCSLIGLDQSEWTILTQIHWFKVL